MKPVSAACDKNRERSRQSHCIFIPPFDVEDQFDGRNNGDRRVAGDWQCPVERPPGDHAKEKHPAKVDHPRRCTF